MKTFHATLLYVIKDNKILLGLKKRGFGKGLLNGIGGKIENGETIEQAMIRETQEEIGITPTKFEKVAVLHFDEWFKGERANLISHVFFATEYTGEPVESDEMKPAFYDIDKIPYDKMFEDDRYWKPAVLSGKKIKGFFQYDENFKLLSHNVEEVDSPGDLA